VPHLHSARRRRRRRRRRRWLLFFIESERASGEAAVGARGDGGSSGGEVEAEGAEGQWRQKKRKTMEARGKRRGVIGNSS
jgi:hypothetical protein